MSITSRVRIVDQTLRWQRRLLSFTRPAWLRPRILRTRLRNPSARRIGTAPTCTPSLDSTIYHDEINALKSPYTIRIGGVDKAKPDAQDAVRLVARLINERCAYDRGTDLEMTILAKD
jgi:hypothetical protein